MSISSAITLDFGIVLCWEAVIPELRLLGAVSGKAIVVAIKPESPMITANTLKYKRGCFINSPLRPGMLFKDKPEKVVVSRIVDAPGFIGAVVQDVGGNILPVGVTRV